MAAKAPSTQDHIPIAGIQDGVLIMNDGSLRAVVKVEPINFELKSENEQNAIIYSYQAFLNSLEFPIQIVFQSKRLDLNPYLGRLEEMAKQQGNELLREQSEDYIGFVRRLISVAKIMAKRFYVVVGHARTGKASFSLLNHHPNAALMDQNEFDRLRSETLSKASILEEGLNRIGCRTEPLETQALIELFYNIYNPDVSSEERLTATEDISSGIVTSPQAAALGQQLNPAAVAPAVETETDPNLNLPPATSIPAEPATANQSDPALPPLAEPSPEATPTQKSASLPQGVVGPESPNPAPNEDPV